MLYMRSTLLVSKLDTSRFVRDEQLPNMLFMFVTLLVSKLDKSRVVRDEQFKNMPEVSVKETLSTAIAVLRFSVIELKTD